MHQNVQIVFQHVHLCSSVSKKKQEMSRTKDLLKDHIPIVTLRRVKDLAVRSGLQELGGQD
jgi:hypothetical protein